MTINNKDQSINTIKSWYRSTEQACTKRVDQGKRWFHQQSPTVQYGIVACSTLVSFFALRHMFRASFVRRRNVDSLREGHLRKQMRLSGIVPHVGDGDNFRFYHVPPLVPFWWVRLFKLAQYPRMDWWSRLGLASSSKNKRDSKLKLDEYTIHVRLAGMDAPECAHFGQPGQEYGPVAKQYLTELLMNKRVTLYPIRKDQYNRLVCAVYMRTWSHWFGLVPENVSAHMLKKGLGVVYEGQGEVWSEGNQKRNLKMKQYFVQLQERAMKQKVGMWKKKSTSVSPRDYKREFAASASVSTTNTTSNSNSTPKIKKK